MLNKTIFQNINSLNNIRFIIALRNQTQILKLVIAGLIKIFVTFNTYKMSYLNLFGVHNLKFSKLIRIIVI